MEFEFLAYLSWREVLIAVVVLLVLYVLFAFLRISRLKNEALRAQDLSTHAAQSAAAAYAAVQDPGPLQEPSLLTEQGVSNLPIQSKEEIFPWNEPPADISEQRKIESLAQEVAQLHREIGGLRSEVQSLREEQRREMTKVQVVQSASPFYSDAMQMAMQGQEAADISLLCGISRAEAELVVALARNQNKPLN